MVFHYLLLFCLYHPELSNITLCYTMAYGYTRCVKSVRVLSFSGLYYLEFELSTEIYRVILDFFKQTILFNSFMKELNNTI